MLKKCWEDFVLLLLAKDARSKKSLSLQSNSDDVEFFFSVPDSSNSSVAYIVSYNTQLLLQLPPAEFLCICLRFDFDIPEKFSFYNLMQVTICLFLIPF